MKNKKTVIIVLIALFLVELVIAGIIINDRAEARKIAQKKAEAAQEAENKVKELEAKKQKDIKKYTEKYGKFVLVDIASQNLKFYENGEEKLSADIISGTKDKDDTPQGEYSVYNKVPDTRITGPDWDYEIKYWIGFIGNEYGIHDAWWQDENQFRSHKAYLKEGSHGCINMMQEDIGKLFNMIEEGDAIIITEY